MRSLIIVALCAFVGCDDGTDDGAAVGDARVGREVDAAVRADDSAVAPRDGATARDATPGDAALVDVGALDGAPPSDAAPDTSWADAAPQPDASGRQDAAPAPDAAAPAADPRTYCESAVEVFCPFYLRCGRMAAEDMDDCRARFADNCEALYEPLYASLVDVGRLRYAPEALAECAAHLDIVRCEAQVFDLDGPCGRIWVGDSPVGAVCGPGIDSFVCQPGSACRLGLDFCGTCEPAADVGQACDAELRCGPEATCVEGTCVARAVPGEPCGQAGCVVGIACVDGTCAPRTRPGLGDGCGAGASCPYAAACVGGVCVEAHPVGDACDAETPCAANRCAAGVCAAPGKPGEACAEGRDCLAGICDGGRCAALPAGCFAR